MEHCHTEYAEMINQIDWPSKVPKPRLEAKILNNYVKETISSSLDLSTQRIWCWNMSSQLGNISQEKKAEYLETSLKWLAKNKKIIDQQDKFKVAREAYDDEKIHWYSNQFWKHCDMEPYQRSRDLEAELFCLSRSLTKKYKETDLVCNRVYQDYNKTRLHDIVRLMNVNKDKLHGVVDKIGNKVLPLKPLYQ